MKCITVKYFFKKSTDNKREASDYFIHHIVVAIWKWQWCCKADIVVLIFKSYIWMCLFIAEMLEKGEETTHQRCFDFLTKIYLVAYLPDAHLCYSSTYLEHSFLLFFIPVKQMPKQGGEL